MNRLKLADLADEKPVRVTVELSARLHRELVAYAVAINGGEAKGAPAVEREVCVSRPRVCEGAEGQSA
jgi:hypothetical protein